MQPPIVEFFFDFISPYAYLAWKRLPAICARHNAELRLKPVLFAGLLGHWGHLGPAEIPPKREWLFKDVLRFAAKHQIEFSLPKFHPFNPLTALRLALPEVSGAQQETVVAAIWEAGWGRGGDLGAPEELRGALDRAGLDGASLLEKTKEPAVKEALRKNTEEAIRRGVFGVPTMMVGEELFWGSDRLDDLSLFLEGKDPIDPARVKEILAHYKGSADRLKRPLPKR